MEQYANLLRVLRTREMSQRLSAIYGRREGMSITQVDRYSRIIRRYAEKFGEQGELRFFSAPGRTEIGGNHTDHNGGEVLAAAITLDAIAAVTPTYDGVITLYSEGFETSFIVDTADTEPREEHNSQRLIRGIAARMKQLSLPVGGFNAIVSSNVLQGSGLSSSACFEVLVCAMLDGLYNGMQIDAAQRAEISQWAENNYMHKPCGLMDQMASSRGGMVHILFGGPAPKVRALDVDFANYGYSIVVTDTGSSHDDLTDEYASIPTEMRAVAAALGGNTLHEIMPEQLLEEMPALRKVVSDRAILRAMHFCDENQRVRAMVDALNRGDVPGFFRLIRESGESSWKLLQNLYVGGSAHQSLPLALEITRRVLRGHGAYRVHGGGFAGTILAFVPDHLLSEYQSAMSEVFGHHCCTVLDTRSQGAIEVDISEG